VRQLVIKSVQYYLTHGVTMKVVLVHAMKACGDLGYSSTNSEPRR